jgi:hypothetical protein
MVEEVIRDLKHWCRSTHAQRQVRRKTATLLALNRDRAQTHPLGWSLGGFAITCLKSCRLRFLAGRDD